MRSLSTILASAAAFMLPLAASAQSNSDAALGAGFGILGILFFLFFMALGIGFLVFWAMMLMDCVHREWPDKTMWLVILIVSLVFGLHWVAALVYFFVIKKKNVGTMQVKGSTPPPSQPPAAPMPPTTPPAV